MESPSITKGADNSLASLRDGRFPLFEVHEEGWVKLCKALIIRLIVARPVSAP
jgi:hypothetical protein